MRIGSELSVPMRRPVRSGGGVAIAASAPVTPPLQNPNPTLPDPRKATDLGQALLHPLQTIKGLFGWVKNVMAFDALGAITPANAPAALARLEAADAGVLMSALGHLLPFLGRAIDSRAAKALTQLRPGIEQDLGARALHPVNLMWPVRGSNLSNYKELMLFSETFRSYPDPIVQKTLAGIASIDVQHLDVWDMGNPVKRQAATLVVQRPITWLPGQRTMDESLRRYMDAQGAVSVNV